MLQLETRNVKPSNTYRGYTFNQFNTLMNGASEIYYAHTKRYLMTTFLLDETMYIFSIDHL